MDTSHASPKLRDNFLGQVAEICLVTPDIYKAMDGFLKLGIGPFQVFHFNNSTVHTMSYKGESTEFELRVAFAKQGSLVIEIMQPLSGPSLMADYLQKSGGKEGIQHVAFDCNNVPLDERKKNFAQRGFDVGMEGIWKGRKGQCHFCFFDTEGDVGTVVESIDFSDDWEDPDCEWYPSKPAGGSSASQAG